MRLNRAIGAFAIAGALVAGCGSSSSPSSNSGASNGIASQSASAILTAAVNSIKSANSMTVTGTYGADAKGSQITKGNFFSNGDADASLVINGGSAHLIKIGGTDYLNADATFWAGNHMPANYVPKLAGVWVSTRASHPAADVSLDEPAAEVGEPVA